MHPSDIEWLHYLRNSGDRIAQMLDQYIDNIDHIAPDALVNAAKKYRDGLRDMGISRGEYRALVEEFTSELEKVSGQAIPAE